VLGRELEDVIREFEQLTAQYLPLINQGLAGQRLEPIRLITEPEWQKQN
jgi:hypothetical protein